MKLNKTSKVELRAQIEKFLEEVPEGMRIPIDKEILENLLFEKSYYFDDGKKILAKYIVWSGDFLQKIDLSEVSFDNVEWDIGYFKKYGDKFLEDKEDHYKGIDVINLSKTNAKIDFKKSFQFLAFGSVALYNCNLSYLDLSNANTRCVDEISGCDISFTKFVLNVLNFKVWCSKLVGINLSNFTVESNFFDDEGELENFIFNSDISNSGLQVAHKCNVTKEEKEAYRRIKAIFVNHDEESIVSISSKDRKKVYDDWSKAANYMEYLQLGKILGKLISDGKLNGCFVNGKKILTPEERKQLAQQKMLEYNQFKEQEFNKILSSLKRQLKKNKL